jgi:hypothetical protein
VLDRVNAAFEAMADPANVRQIEEADVIPYPAMSRAQVERFMRSEYETLVLLVRGMGVRLGIDRALAPASLRPGPGRVGYDGSRPEDHIHPVVARAPGGVREGQRRAVAVQAVAGRGGVPPAPPAGRA